ncbi:MAG: hypothetical protein ABI885_09665 [Gammaproteobacteria bacterium]
MATKKLAKSPTPRRPAQSRKHDMADVKVMMDLSAHKAYRQAFDAMWAVALREKLPASVSQFVTMYCTAMRDQLVTHESQWGLSPDGVK